LQPTKGSYRTSGRISALLELGAGFNPEFTGLENARLNASLMGLDPAEFEQALPDIIEFSGLGDFLERPVKTYSSGMFVRLAFAVAINMRPDVLIIDEALAVGDIRFQSKCFRRLDELKANNTNDTDLDPNIDYCPQQMAYNVNEERWGDGRAKIFHYELLVDGKPNFKAQSGQRIQIKFRVAFFEALEGLIFGLTIKLPGGETVYGTNTRLQESNVRAYQPGEQVTVSFEFDANLLSNDYFMSLGVAQDHLDKDNIAIDRRYDMVHLQIDNVGQAKAYGLAELNAQIELQINS